MTTALDQSRDAEWHLVVWDNEDYRFGVVAYVDSTPRRSTLRRTMTDVSAPAFTKGPWRVLPLKNKYYGTKVALGDDPDSAEVTIWGADYSRGVSYREIANGWDANEPYYDHTESAIDIANAYLIAAAPDLYEALMNQCGRCAMDGCGHHGACNHTPNQCAALAKARGE